MKRTLAIIYDVADRSMEHVVKEGKRLNRPIVCTKGCHACCNLLPTAMLAEALEMVLELKRNCPAERIVEIYAKLLHQTRWLLRRDARVNDWWELQDPCAALHDGLCSVYEKRPVMCRIYAVLTDPKSCEGPATGQVLRVNTGKIRDFAWESGSLVHAEYEVPNLFGPLPFLLLCAFNIHVRGIERFLAGIEGSVFADSKRNLVFWLRLEGEKRFRELISPKMERDLFGPRGLDELFDEHGDFLINFEEFVMT